MDLLIIMGILLGARQMCLGAMMGGAFTCQGRLTSGGSPADEAPGFAFKLCDVAAAGNRMGSTGTPGNLVITNGYSTTPLDFGSDVFTCNARGLRIAVRPDPKTGAYTALTHWPELIPAPCVPHLSVSHTPNWVSTFTSSGLADSVTSGSNGKLDIGATKGQDTLRVNWGTATDVALFESTDPAALILLKDNNTAGTGEAIPRRAGISPRPMHSRKAAFSIPSECAIHMSIHGWLTAASEWRVVQGNRHAPISLSGSSMITSSKTIGWSSCNERWGKGHGTDHYSPKHEE